MRRFAPLGLGLLLFALFFASALDPRVQLYYRDTGRLYYPVKLYIAQALRGGRLPLWDEMTESGVGLLGQLTPGLLHPATLLYLVFPFDLAFKLNHLLGPLLGGVGAALLARRLRASAWASLAAAVAYGGCGYLVSVAGSNLPFALGAGTVPLAVDAALRFVERPTAGRLAWGGAALASIGLAGEPQSMLIAGLAAAIWALLESPRAAWRVAACGALALLFAAPAALPAWAELRRSNRIGPLSAHDRAAFANPPSRLLGLLVPRAFDDRVETEASAEETTYREFFAEDSAAFADSIVLGAPALLFAAAALWTRRGRRLLAFAALLALASTGEALGVQRLLPLSGFFRFAEKLIAPASLLLALAAAVGVDQALDRERRPAARLTVAAAALGAACALFGLVAPSLAAPLAAFGRTHSTKLAAELCEALRSGLFDAAGLSLAVAAVALWRWLRQRPAAWLAPLCCAGSALASSAGLLYTAPLRFLRGPFELGEQMLAEAGPSSPGRWRMFVNSGPLPGIAGLPPRLQASASAAEALLPQFETVMGIEGMNAYFSAGDPHYVRAIHDRPERAFEVFGARFVVEMPAVFTAEEARRRGFRAMGPGYWVRENPPWPRATVAGRPAALERPSPEAMRIDAAGPGLLVVGEHFDPGWRATVNGVDAPVIETDLAAIGVQLPGGPARVELRYAPPGFRPGLALALAAAIALAVAGRRRRR